MASGITDYDFPFGVMVDKVLCDCYGCIPELDATTRHDEIELISDDASFEAVVTTDRALAMIDNPIYPEDARTVTVEPQILPSIRSPVFLL
jgi:hypothetical protein